MEVLDARLGHAPGHIRLPILISDPMLYNMDWYYKTAGEQVGPFSEEQMRGLVRSGVLSSEAQVRSGPDGPWRPAGKALVGPDGLETFDQVDEGGGLTELRSATAVGSEAKGRQRVAYGLVGIVAIGLSWATIQTYRNANAPDIQDDVMGEQTVTDARPVSSVSEAERETRLTFPADSVDGCYRHKFNFTIMERQLEPGYLDEGPAWVLSTTFDTIVIPKAHVDGLSPEQKAWFDRNVTPGRRLLFDMSGGGTSGISCAVYGVQLPVTERRDEFEVDPSWDHIVDDRGLGRSAAAIRIAAGREPDTVRSLDDGRKMWIYTRGGGSASIHESSTQSFLIEQGRCVSVWTSTEWATQQEAEGAADALAERYMETRGANIESMNGGVMTFTPVDTPKSHAMLTLNLGEEGAAPSVFMIFNSVR